MDQQHILQAVQNQHYEELSSITEKEFIRCDSDIQYEIIELLTQAGYFEKADECLQWMIQFFPEENQLVIDRAQLLLEIGKEDQALELLSSIDVNDEVYIQAVLLLADTYQMQGLYEVAERYILEAEKLLPNESVIQFAKAELLFETGRFIEAARIYEQLLTLENEETLDKQYIVTQLAELSRLGGDFEQSLTYYERALEKETTADLLYGAAAAAFQVEQYELTIKRLLEVKELDVDYFSAYLLLAQAYMQTNNEQLALEIIEDGLKRDEYDKELYLFAGKLALKLQLPERAKQYLEEALALDIGYMEAAIAYASLLNTEEKDEELLDFIKQLEENGEEMDPVIEFAGDAYYRLEQFDQAYLKYKEAYHYLQDDPNFLSKYVYFLIEEGKMNEAQAVAEKLLAIDPDNLEWHDLMETFSN